MSNGYIVEVKIDGKWKGISFIEEKWFNEKDHSFYISPKVRETLGDFIKRPIRLYRMHYSDKDEILGHEVREFRVWHLGNSKVEALDPNKNYKEYVRKHEDWKG